MRLTIFTTPPMRRPSGFVTAVLALGCMALPTAAWSQNPKLTGDEMIVAPTTAPADTPPPTRSPSDSSQSGSSPSGGSSSSPTSSGTAPSGTPPASQCRTVEQASWVAAVGNVQLQTTQTSGGDADRLACDMALARIESQGEQRCQTNYSGSTLYRNGTLLPMSLGFGDCDCQGGPTRTVCTVSVTAQCSYEVLQTQAVQVCD